MSFVLYNLSLVRMCQKTFALLTQSISLFLSSVLLIVRRRHLTARDKLSLCLFLR